MIELNNISFSYDAGPIFRSLTLKIKSGSWLGLIGPNGAGKTTLLNIISGLLAPESGKVIIDGNNIKTYSRKELAKLIAVVPQMSPLSFSFSALEVVLMGRHPYLKKFGLETSDDIEKAKEAMIVTDTWRFRERAIDQLSGGERQRVFIARALAERPKILLLDEPTAFLDIRHQIQIMNILAKLSREQNITIIAAIHDINLAISYCSEIALLSEGKIYKKGSPADVITYANLKEIFESEMYVGINDLTGKPYYVPMNGSLNDL